MTSENEIEEDDDNEDGADWDLYPIEKVNGDMVWACNLCDHDFDSSVEMKNHMTNEHDKILNSETAALFRKTWWLSWEKGTLYKRT